MRYRAIPVQMNSTFAASRKPTSETMDHGQSIRPNRSLRLKRSSKLLRRRNHAGASMDQEAAKNIKLTWMRISLETPNTIAPRTWRQYQPLERPQRNSSSRSPASASLRGPGTRCSNIHVATGGGSPRLICALLSSPAIHPIAQTARGELHAPGVNPRSLIGNISLLCRRAQAWDRRGLKRPGACPQAAPVPHTRCPPKHPAGDAFRVLERWAHRRLARPVGSRPEESSARTLPDSFALSLIQQ